MWRPRLAAALCAAAALATIPAVSSAHAPEPGPGVAHPSDRAQQRLAMKDFAMDRAGTVLDKDTGGTGDGPPPNIYDGNNFAGPDGIYYERSPLMVPGNNGTVYFGEEMDIACAVGRHYKESLKALAKLAKLIERSGKKVVFTTAPNKSAVNKHDLPAQLPQQLCDLQGIAAQDHDLDSFKNPDYVQVRRKLEKDSNKGVPNYWHVDTHWTTLASSKYTDALARKLDPRLARLQSFRSGEETILVDLSFLGYIGDTYETQPARFSSTKVHVSPAKGSKPYDPQHEVDTELAWNTSPAKRTWPGHTTLIGDSFTYRGLNNLMPLFEHGHFLWTGSVPLQKLLDGIVDADTVVLEIVQRYVPFSLLTQPAFYDAVRQALKAAHPHRHHR
jgi:hypothetical protein